MYKVHVHVYIHNLYIYMCRVFSMNGREGRIDVTSFCLRKTRMVYLCVEAHAFHLLAGVHSLLPFSIPLHTRTPLIHPTFSVVYKYGLYVSVPQLIFPSCSLSSRLSLFNQRFILHLSFLLSRLAHGIQ